MQCKVTLLLAANSRAVRAGEHTRPRYSNSYTAPLDFKSPCVFSTRFTVHNSISVLIIFRRASKWWGWPLIARARAPVCPSLAMPLLAIFKKCFVTSQMPYSWRFSRGRNFRAIFAIKHQLAKISSRENFFLQKFLADDKLRKPSTMSSSRGISNSTEN